MHEDAPPLKVWAYSAGIALGFLSLFLIYAYFPFGPYAITIKRSNANLEKALIENNTSDTSVVSLVILGSSMTERGLIDPYQLAKDLSERTGKKVNVLRVAIFFMNMDLANRIDFFEHISKHPPQYLFLENAAMNLDDVNSMELPEPIDAALLDLRNRIRTLIGLSAHENYYLKWYTFDTHPAPDNDFYTGNFDSAAYEALKLKARVVRKPEENARANLAYNALAKANCKVIFLGYPRAEGIPKNFLTDESAVELDKVIAYYHEHYGVGYWPYDEALSPSEFMDGIHMNYRGAATYESWFVSQFAAKK